MIAAVKLEYQSYWAEVPDDWTARQAICAFADGFDMGDAEEDAEEHGTLTLHPGEEEEEDTRFIMGASENGTVDWIRAYLSGSARTQPIEWEILPTIEWEMGYVPE